MSNNRFWKWLDGWTRISHLSFPVPAHAKNLSYTLGGITLVGFILLFVTGLILVQFFNPQSDSANQSVRYIVEEVPGGNWIRSFHYWTSQAVILSMCAHMIRVFISGSYKFPRILTWYFGVGLFFTATMLAYFSGTILKWDQEAYEALEHYEFIAGMLGPLGTLMGSGLTESVSLNIRMYSFHITLAPLILIAMVIGHFYLIHVFNISPLPRGPHSRMEEVPPSELTGTFMEHSWSIVRYSLIFYGLVAVLSAVVAAPLEGPPSPEVTGIKPPWIYYWQYGIENFFGMPAILYSTVVLLLLFLLVPLVDRGPSRDPKDRKGILALGALTGLVLLALTLYAWVSPEQVHDGHEHEGSMEQEAEMKGMESGDSMGHSPGLDSHDDRPENPES